MAGETRRKIVEATERLIKMKGLARVTTKEIARETGLSEGALYRHFEHKEEVFFEIIAQNLPTFLEVFTIRQPGSGDLADNLQVIALAAMQYFSKLVPLSASFLADTELLAQYRAKMSQLIVVGASDGPQKIQELLAAYLDEERQLGRLPASLSPYATALALLGACFQFTYLHQLMGGTPQGQTEEQFVRELIQGLLKSLLSA